MLCGCTEVLKRVLLECEMVFPCCNEQLRVELKMKIIIQVFQSHHRLQSRASWVATLGTIYTGVRGGVVMGSIIRW